MDKFYVYGSLENFDDHASDTRPVVYLASEVNARIDELEQLLRFASCYVVDPGWDMGCPVRKMRERILAVLPDARFLSDIR